MLSALLLLLFSTLTVGLMAPSKNFFSLSESISNARPIRQTGNHCNGHSNKSCRTRQNELSMMKRDSDTNPFYEGQDAYQILEVSRNADKRVIKSSYRKAISTWHPDKFPDDDEKKAEGNLRMEKINRAWYCLGDDDRKRRYDQFGDQGVGTSASSEEQIKAAGSPINSGGFRGGQGSGAVNINDIADIFDTFFGGADGVRGDGGFNRQQQQKQKLKNNNVPVTGTFCSV